MLKEDLRDMGWGDHVTVLQPPSYEGKLRSTPLCIEHKYVSCSLAFGVTKAQILARSVWLFQSLKSKAPSTRMRFQKLRFHFTENAMKVLRQHDRFHISFARPNGNDEND